MEMIHPGLGTTRARGHITCAPDPPIIHHCLLKLQFIIWLHIRLSLITTDGGIKLELVHKWSAHYVEASIKEIVAAQQNDLKKQKWREILPMSWAVGNVPSHIFCVEREVGSGKSLVQLVKWLKSEKLKDQGPGSQRKRHENLLMGMNMKYEHICILCNALQRASNREEIIQQPSREN